MYKEVFSSRLKKAREYSGLTQQDVGKALRIDRSTYTAYERGINEPSIETLAMLSKLFDVSADWLIGLTSDSNLGSLSEVLENRERERILKKLEKEAALAKKVWGA